MDRSLLLRVYGKVCSGSEPRRRLEAFVRQKIELAIMTDTALADC